MATLINHTITETQRDNAVSSLTNIIETLCDSVDGYYQSADIVRDSHQELAGYFDECAAKRQEKIDELRQHLRRYSEDANVDVSGTLVGDMHQYFVSFRALFQDGEDVALNEVARGESHLLEQYVDAMDCDIPQELATILRRQHADISRRENMIEDLREAS